MSVASTARIPYERQQDARSCGAAALCMVYRSLGLSAAQSDVWARVARPGPWNTPRTNTKNLCADAREQGFNALTLQARQPWPILQHCAAHGVRVILNHLLRSESAAGHYSVLVAAQDDHLILHDPAGTEERVLSKEDFLELWEPASGRSEISGRVLVAIDARPQDMSCSLCGTATPASISCPWCEQSITVQPALALGCVIPICPARLWDVIFCPHCDLPLTTL